MIKYDITFSHLANTDLSSCNNSSTHYIQQEAAHVKALGLTLLKGILLLSVTFRVLSHSDWIYTSVVRMLSSSRLNGKLQLL